jgi:hypothetical protein
LAVALGGHCDLLMYVLEKPQVRVWAEVTVANKININIKTENERNDKI